ncbi:MAG TPA: hypothetical protein VMJ90_08965 [Anaerolineales bacterium]|nr:hypothetical protein [Anaerolineales bacterium]
MSRRIRVLLGIIILALSISLLIWGFAPTRKETRVQPIAPSDLQLPFHFDAPLAPSASSTPFEVVL